MNWLKEKKRLSLIDIYGGEKCIPSTCNVDKKYYFNDNTKIIHPSSSVEYHRIINPYSIDLPPATLESERHRTDGPAIEKENGDKLWYINGKLHREDGPAVILNDGTKRWYKEGNLHREDGPAVEYIDGDKEWYKEGNLHREDGPAIKNINGDEKWYINGKLHRKNNPAVISGDNNKDWYKNGKRHREDGPAVIRKGYTIWYINDKNVCCGLLKYHLGLIKYIAKK